jgi:hypothetical protein
MEYADNLKFKNHDQMKKELFEAGIATPKWCKSEAELVHLYDITFLVGNKIKYKNS